MTVSSQHRETTGMVSEDESDCDKVLVTKGALETVATVFERARTMSTTSGSTERREGDRDCWSNLHSTASTGNYSMPSTQRM